MKSHWHSPNSSSGLGTSKENREADPAACSVNHLLRNNWRGYKSSSERRWHNSCWRHVSVLNQKAFVPSSFLVPRVSTAREIGGRHFGRHGGGMAGGARCHSEGLRLCDILSGGKTGKHPGRVLNLAGLSQILTYFLRCLRNLCRRTWDTDPSEGSGSD